MSEREVLLTGIGGQGVQLAAQVLARAGVRDGRHVLLFGVYGGAMRGMNTDATVVLGDAPVQAPPLLSRAWSAFAMHDRYWAPVAPKIAGGGLVIVNDSTFAAPLDRDRYSVRRVRATELAAELGNDLTASMVLLGAFVALTGVVGRDALLDGMRDSVPAYRRQHLDANEAALRAGAEAVHGVAVPAWDAASAPA
ncbi:MAG TPA: 2-oxoacid:acceptor oxidoreductase family protein [Acidimicrobiia bacterium]|nr:2-oxoacid:acceptor oxidoreductase family protein [Acidimicrobiia bacterium]